MWLSVIVPTLDESRCLADAVRSVGPRGEVEVIVVDGGSADDTVEVAEKIADRVVAAPRGRAAQLNAGAAVARGEALLFLHADSRLPEGAADRVRCALASAEAVGGAFAVAIESPRRSLGVLSRLINWRARRLGAPYGDQALFVRRADFEAIGAYRQLEIMEDVDLVRRLRRRGRLVWIADPVRISDRRWRANGVVRTTAVNLAAAGLYRMGVSPRRIRRWYDALLSAGKPPGPAPAASGEAIRPGGTP